MIRRLAALLVLPAALLAQGASPEGPSQAEYRTRREALMAGTGDAIVVVPGAPEPAADYQTFYQNPDFQYLTGILEPNATLIMAKQAGRVHEFLFVMPRDARREVWTGTRIGAQGASRRTGMDARSTSELDAVLDSLVATKLPVQVIAYAGEQATPDVLSPEQQAAARIRQRAGALFAGSALADSLERMRGHKSDAELSLIRRAVDITVQAQREAMRAWKPGMNEYEIQALIEYTFRRNGAERPSFATIVGSGPNATTLHYNADDRLANAGDLVVMDIGASYRGYAADVTRTIPVSGTFTPDQRAVYQLVRDAQAAAERQAKPGAGPQAMSDSASAVLARGLAKLGLIESDTATYDCAVSGASVRRCPQYRMYYMHGLGHGIGLEVHDPDQYYFTGVLAPGSAFTIEPGLYIRADALDVLPESPRNAALRAKLRAALQRYQNIGVRIEDDYFVTANGVEWVSKAPREILEVESLMRSSSRP